MWLQIKFEAVATVVDSYADERDLGVQRKGAFYEEENIISEQELEDAVAVIEKYQARRREKTLATAEEAASLGKCSVYPNVMSSGV